MKGEVLLRRFRIMRSIVLRHLQNENVSEARPRQHSRVPRVRERVAARAARLGGVGMPRAEAKSEGKDDGEEKSEAKPLRARRLSTGQLISPLVVAFCEFCTTEAFEGEVSEFIEANCAEFAGHDLGGEQLLSWTALHRDWLELVERRLEGFCKEHDTSAEAVFKLVSDTNDDPSIEGALLPMVFQNVEYKYFFENMRAAAEAKTIKQAALDAGERAGAVNLSGVFDVVRERTDPAELSEFLRRAKTPWMIRKVFEKAAMTITDVYVVHTERSLTFTYKMAFIGANEISFLLDGKEHMVLDLFRQECPTTGEMRGNKAIRTTTGSPAMPPGSYSEQTFGMERLDGEDLLVWTQSRFPVGGEAYSAPPFYFRRRA